MKYFTATDVLQRWHQTWDQAVNFMQTLFDWLMNCHELIDSDENKRQQQAELGETASHRLLLNRKNTKIREKVGAGIFDKLKIFCIGVPSTTKWH